MTLQEASSELYKELLYYISNQALCIGIKENTGTLVIYWNNLKLFPNQIEKFPKEYHGYPVEYKEMEGWFTIE